MIKQMSLYGASLCLLVLPSAGRAASDEADTTIRISTGVEYTTGDYGGTADIDETYVPLTFSLTRGRVNARVTVPYLRVDGPAGALYGDPIDGADPAADQAVSESGLGDVVASLTVFDVLTSGRLDMAVDLTGKVKFGTADAETGLGTGENDYTVLVDVYKFVGSGALVGTVGYKFRGEPAGVTLEDVFVGSVGGLMEVGKGGRFGLFYDYREASLLNGDELREVSVFGSNDLGGAWRVQYYLFTGFTDSGPDWGGGIQLGVNLPKYSTRHLD
jgi:hypothetical protein